MALLSGIHPIAEALRAASPIERIVIAQGAGGPRLQEIIDAPSPVASMRQPDTRPF